MQYTCTDYCVNIWGISKNNVNAGSSDFPWWIWKNTHLFQESATSCQRSVASGVCAENPQQVDCPVAHVVLEVVELLTSGPAWQHIKHVQINPISLTNKSLLAGFTVNKECQRIKQSNVTPKQSNIINMKIHHWEKASWLDQLDHSLWYLVPQPQWTWG